MMTDPIADMLTRIRNAGFARLEETSCPFSQLKLAIARLLNEEGFLTSVRVEPRDGPGYTLCEASYALIGRQLSAHALIRGHNI